jgi:hypothetical protein
MVEAEEDLLRKGLRVALVVEIQTQMLPQALEILLLPLQAKVMAVVHQALLLFMAGVEVVLINQGATLLELLRQEMLEMAVMVRQLLSQV